MPRLGARQQVRRQSGVISGSRSGQAKRRGRVQIDREADLLNRGRSAKTLEGLRGRIRALFLAFIETPEFNPEAASIQAVPADANAFVLQAAS